MNATMATMSGHLVSPADRRRLQAKIAAAKKAEAVAARAAAEVDELLVQLADAGASVSTLLEATGDEGSDTRMSRSALHRRLQAAQTAATARSLHA